MELLLINHPLDCPICDKGGECPLQNQAMTTGRTDSRFLETKRTFPKPIPISTQVLLDRERCVLCQRCTRFSEEIAGDPFIDLLERGAEQQIGVAAGQAVPELLLRQHHPDLPGRRADQRGLPVPLAAVRPGLHAGRVRALRVRLRDAHRHPPRHRAAPAGRQRPRGQRGVDLRQEPLRVPLPDARRAGSPGRWCAAPTGVLVEASWTEALRVAARGAAGGPRAAASGCWPAAGSPSRTPTPTPSSPGSPRTPTTSTSGPARTRPRSWTSWPRTWSAPVPSTLSYTALEAAPAVLCVALEPEEEAPIVFLRLRKAARKHRQRVFHLGQWSTPGGAAHRARDAAPPSRPPGTT